MYIYIIKKIYIPHMRGCSTNYRYCERPYREQTRIILYSKIAVDSTQNYKK